MGMWDVKKIWDVKKLALAVAFCASLICSPVQAKTFVGVLWPMFGPLPAIGLVELVAELKTQPDVEVKTYLHQEWPNLVEDLARQEPGTHTFVIGYSLGANATAFVANKSKYIDLIIALQPSMLSWNPPVTGKVGRMIEVYNPNPWMTFGGMGSKKLEGPNIEYIANNDSHPGAQFNSDFRDLVKRELANFTAEDRQQKDSVETAQAAAPAPVELPQPAASTGLATGPATRLGYAEEGSASQQGDAAAKGQRQIAQIEVPLPKPRPVYVGLEHVAPEHGASDLAQAQPKHEPAAQPSKEKIAFLDSLSNLASSGDLSGASSGDLSAVSSGSLSAVNSGDSAAKRELTLTDMTNYANRTYGASRTADNLTASAQR
jgi:hypothetical protein